MYGSSGHSTSLPTVDVALYKFSHFSGRTVVSHCAFNLHFFLMTNAVEQFFMEILESLCIFFYEVSF